MAEFQELMKQKNRMCESYKTCYECDLNVFDCNYFKDEDLPVVEKIIMDWAKEHPEYKYPTWYEWSRENFPNSCTLTLCLFDPNIKKTCDSILCSDCVKKEIPKEIAERLGIKPIKHEVI